MATRILAQRYNNLVSRISTILNSGYGQTLYSAPVQALTGQSLTNAYKVTVEDYKNLYIDIARARMYQVGASTFTPQPFVTRADKVTDAYMTSLESLMTLVENDVNLVSGVLNYTLENIKNVDNSTVYGATTTPWNGSLSYQFTITFTSQSARTQFFNKGGLIQIDTALEIPPSVVGVPAIPAQSVLKSNAWNNFLLSIGRPRFGKSETVILAGQVGTGSSVGNDNLTSTPQTIFSAVSSSYSGNTVTMSAALDNATTIRFTITFSDSHTEGTDELVYGRLTVSPKLLTPTFPTVTINGITINGTSIPGNIRPSGATVKRFSTEPIMVSYELLGGGGAGGRSISVGGEELQGTFAQSGDNSRFYALSSDNPGVDVSVIPSITAPGGAGGENCGGARNALGSAGGTSTYTVWNQPRTRQGGAATSQRTAGNDAPFAALGAGGAGAGGDTNGCAGLGGSAGTSRTGTVSIPAGTVMTMKAGRAGYGGKHTDPEIKNWPGGDGYDGFALVYYNYFTSGILNPNIESSPNFGNGFISSSNFYKIVIE